ncbi:MAG: class I SAM-dependent methyltransferase [Candidatus Paceibacterota bacterium]
MKKNGKDIVANFYDAVPYHSAYFDGPASGRTRGDSYPRTLLEWSGRTIAPDETIRVLDAGCGRGESFFVMAKLNPDISFTAIDISRAAVASVQKEIRARGLKNADVFEADIMRLDPKRLGMFDVVLASGVIHHLADPVRGMRALRRVTKPDGVMSVMVYGAYRREVTKYVREFLAIALPRRTDEPVMAYAARAKAFIAQIPNTVPMLAFGQADAADISDIEFADRYLHPREKFYTVPEWFAECRKAKWKFLRWHRPDEWDMPLPETARQDLAPAERYHLAGLAYRADALSCLLVPDTRNHPLAKKRRRTG